VFDDVAQRLLTAINERTGIKLSALLVDNLSAISSMRGFGLRQLNRCDLLDLAHLLVGTQRGQQNLWCAVSGSVR
jgi:hypothetical protein